MKDNQHKDFDNFFQNKLNDRQFEFKDDFWDEMETLLPKNDTDLTPAGNNRSRLGWGILLLALIGFVTWFAYPKTDIRLTVNEHSNSNSNSNSNTNANTNANTNSNANSNTNANSNANIVSVNTDFENINQQNKLHQTNNLISNQKSNTTTKASSESQTKANIENNNNIENRNIPNSTIINNENTIELTKENIKKDNNSNVKPIDNNSLNNSLNNTLNNVNNQLTAPTLPIIFNENNKNKTQKGQNTIENEAIPNAKLLLTKPFALETKTEKRDIQIGKLNCDGCPIKPTFHSLTIGLNAGLSVSQGFKNAMDFRARPSFDPTVGLSLSYRHSPISDWSINTGVLYASRSSLNASINYDSTIYGFGVTTISRTINIEELHYINVPFYAVYTKKQHQFMGGLTVNYLLNAQSTTQGTIETLNYDATEFATEAATQQWGYKAAFNRLDFGVSIGYDYQVVKGWKIGTRINYGFVDVAKNSVFNRSTFDNNFNIRLLLTYDLKELAF